MNQRDIVLVCNPCIKGECQNCLYPSQCPHPHWERINMKVIRAKCNDCNITIKDTKTTWEHAYLTGHHVIIQWALIKFHGTVEEE